MGKSGLGLHHLIQRLKRFAAILVTGSGASADHFCTVPENKDSAVRPGFPIERFSGFNQSRQGLTLCAVPQMKFSTALFKAFIVRLHDGIKVPSSASPPREASPELLQRALRLALKLLFYVIQIWRVTDLPY